MECNIKPITKQLIIAVSALVSVTVLSFGIRRIRLSTHRAGTIEKSVAANQSTPARPSNPENQPKQEQPLGVKAEPDYYPDDSYTIDYKHDSQYADVSDWDEQTPSDDDSKAHTDPVNYDKDVSKTKSFKGGYAKSGDTKASQKISLSKYENLYLTKEGEAWYVSEQPDGSTAKMQVQVDEATGKLTAVGRGYYAKSEGSLNLQRISMGKNEDLYLTGNDELWYVSELPDGSTAKMQLQTENINGEMTIVDSGEMNVYPADSDKSNED